MLVRQTIVRRIPMNFSLFRMAHTVLLIITSVASQCGQFFHGSIRISRSKIIIISNYYILRYTYYIDIELLEVVIYFRIIQLVPRLQSSFIYLTDEMGNADNNLNRV